MLHGFTGHRLLRAPDKDDPAGTGEDDETHSGTRASDVLEQYGRNALRLAEKLAEALSDNYGLRDKNRTLRRERDELKAKLPAEGSAVLSADDAKLLETYRALGTPQALKTSLDGAQSAQQELAGLKRQSTLAKAAEAAGFKAAPLARLVGELDIQVKDGTDGKPVAVVVAEGKETPLADYAQTHWADFLPALAPQGQGAGVQTFDINAGARGARNGAGNREDAIAAEQECMLKSGRYSGF